MTNRRTIFLAGVVLMLAVLAVYRNSLNAPFLFDDSLAVVDNESIHHLWPPWQALSPPPDGSGATGRPLVNLSLAVNYAIGRLDVRGYHVMNLMLHILASLTLWGVLRRTLRGIAVGLPLVGRPWPHRGAARRQAPALREDSDPAAARARLANGPRTTANLPARTVGRLSLQRTDAEFMAIVCALLWAVHPLLTESVVCVVQRNEVMGGMFYLLTLYCFIRANEKPETGDLRPEGKSSPGWLVLSVVSCLLGMASKEIVATAPLLVLLYDRTFVAGTFRAAGQARGKFYGALVATWLPLAWLMAHTGQRGGTVGFGFGITSWEYLLTQSHALMLYLKLSFWPFPLVLDYGGLVIPDLGAAWRQLLLIVPLALATGWALWRRPVLGFIGAWFFVILAPSSSFVPLATQTIAEHRMYLPLAAVIVLVVAGLHALGGRRAVGIGLALAVALGIRTAGRNEDYRDELKIWSEAMAEYPDNVRTQTGVGTAYFHRGDFAAAARCFASVLQRKPGSADSFHNLGLALANLDRPEEARARFAEAVRLMPAFAQAHTELGKQLVKLGRNEEALAHFRTALTLTPESVDALDGLGGALAATGNPVEAAAAYERALAISPTRTDVHFNYGLLEASLGRTTEAVAHYTEATRLDPWHIGAQLNLGILLVQTGRVEEGIGRLRQAVWLKPDLPEAQANLATALAVAGRPAQAVARYEAALRLRPDYAMAHCNLGHALVQLRRWGEARRHFAEALRLKPDMAGVREMLDQLQTVPDGP